MKKSVTFGLIGLGGISQSQHIPNLLKAQRIQLKTVCDLKQELVEDTCGKWGIANGTTDLEQILNDPEIDAVLIATRPDSHLELTLRALDAQKHVYVEKPLAESVEECCKIVQARQRSGKIVAVGFNRRMAPSIQMAKKIALRHGGFKNIHYRLSDAFYIWGADFEPGTRALHEVSHIFDLLRFLCESEVKSVFCASSRYDDESMILTFESGTVASIMSSGFVQYDMPKERFEGILNIGAITIEDFVEMRTYGLDDCEPRICFEGHSHPFRDQIHKYLFKEGAEISESIRRHFNRLFWRLRSLQENEINSPERYELEQIVHHKWPMINYMMDKGWLASLEHFANVILGNEKMQMATAEDGLEATKIALAAIRSRQNHRVEFINSHSAVFDTMVPKK